MKIIEESKQVGILYHCTDVRGLYNIINSNKLKATGNNRDKAISFSRSKNAKSNCVVRIYIDGDKLSNNIKIYPYQDPDWDRDEYEERVDNDISNIKKYILRIDLNSELILDEFPTPYLNNYDSLELFLDKNNINYKLI